MPDTDYEALARREAATTIADANVTVPLASLETLTDLIAVGYVKGYIAGSHATLALAESAAREVANEIYGNIPG